MFLVPQAAVAQTEQGYLVFLVDAENKQDYSMRVWLKPDRMAQLGVTTTDIAQAIGAQNRQNAAGKIGQEPAPEGQQLVYTVTAKGRLLSPEQFGDIIVRAEGPNGVLRIRDIARVELGAQSCSKPSMKSRGCSGPSIACLTGSPAPIPAS